MSPTPRAKERKSEKQKRKQSKAEQGIGRAASLSAVVERAESRPPEQGFGFD
jgi:hypothetical protein